VPRYDVAGELRKVWDARGDSRNRYSGLGTLVLSEWGNPLQTPTIEEYRGDPLGHVYQSRRRGAQTGESDPVLSLLTKVIDSAGRTTRVVQTAYDRAGKHRPRGGLEVACRHLTFLPDSCVGHCSGASSATKCHIPQP
jgi:hypothetical protein